MVIRQQEGCKTGVVGWSCEGGSTQNVEQVAAKFYGNTERRPSSCPVAKLSPVSVTAAKCFNLPFYPGDNCCFVPSCFVFRVGVVGLFLSVGSLTYFN